MARFRTIGTLGDGLVRNLTDLTMGWVSGRLMAYGVTHAGGGMTVWSIGSADNPAAVVATLEWGKGLPHMAEPEAVLIDRPGGGTSVLPAGLFGASEAVRTLRGDGALGLADRGMVLAPLPHDLLTAQSFETWPGLKMLLVARHDTPNFSIWRQFDDGRVVQTAASVARPHLPADAQVDHLEAIRIGAVDLIVSVSTRGNYVALNKVLPDGTLSAGEFFGSERGTGFNGPRRAEHVEVDGHHFLVVNSAGSSSLTTVRVLPGGSLVPVDHVLDERTTRFQGATEMTTVMLDGRAYVIAGGADDGLSLFTVSPDGRLIHLDTIVDAADLALADVSALAAAVIGGRIVVMAASATKAGVSQFMIDPGAIGQTRHVGAGVHLGGPAGDMIQGGLGTTVIKGFGGDDILIAGTGSVALYGGAGADRFVALPLSGRIAIKDFEYGVDTLDLSMLGMIRSTLQLTFQPQSWGIRIRFGETRIDIETVGRRPLSAAMFTDDLFPIAHYQPPDVRSSVVGTIRADLLTAAQGGSTIWGREGNDTILGSGLEDRFIGGPGHDIIHAGLGDDTLEGDAGNDTIRGGGGRDLLSGGDGADALFGEMDDDHLSGHGGNDTLHAGIGNDYLSGGAGDDVLHGNDGDDTLFGDLGDDRLQGGAGNDRLIDQSGNNLFNDWFGDNLFIGGWGRDRMYAGDGRDTMQGGGGDDIILGAAGNDLIETGDGNDLALGGIGADTLLGGGGNDTLYGNSEADFISGGPGHDAIAGGYGDDTLNGDAGRDRMEGDAGNDIMRGGDMGDTMSGGLGHDLMFGNFGRDSMLGGYGDDTMMGDAEDDVLIGEWGNDVLGGGGGADSLFGGDGNDLLNGNDGADLLSGGDGADSLFGDAGNDLLRGNAGNDFLAGGAGDDTVEGQNGDDTLRGDYGDDLLTGGLGNDSMNGGVGHDTLLGEQGDDYLIGSHGDDLIEGGDGADRLFGEWGRDRLFGGRGADTMMGGLDDDLLDGGEGDDLLLGGAGCDTLLGGDGADRLDAGTGDDRLTGGAGADVFVFSSGAGAEGILAEHDVILDFETGIDRVDLTNPGLVWLDVAAFSGHSGEIRWLQTAAGVLIEIDRDGDAAGDMTILLSGQTGLSRDDILL